MATLTKTFTENFHSTNKSTWTVTVKATDTTVTSSTFLPYPTVTAKYVGSGKGYACASVDGYYAVSVSSFDSVGTLVPYNKGSASGYVSWASGTTYTLTPTYTDGSTVRTSLIFNTSNYNSKTVQLHFRAGLSLYSGNNSAGGTTDNWYSINSLYFGAIVNVTLDAPPNLSSITKTKTSNSAGYYWKDISTASVTITSANLQFGGRISSATLTIGEQSATITNTGTTGTVSIVPNAVGTFTPTLTVTDTRGQTTTKTLEDITVQEWQAVSASWGSIQSNNGVYYAGKTTASVTVSDISVMEGFNATEAVLYVGNQSVTSAITGDSATLSLAIDAVGEFTPKVRIYTDAGVYTSHSYQQITVGEYIAPSISYSVERSSNTGVPDYEGDYALVIATLTYIDTDLNLIEPLVTVTDDSGTPASAVIAWYASWNRDNGVDQTSQVNWASYNPQSPATLYGVITGYGTYTRLSQAKPYQVAITPRDSIGTGSQITQMLPQAFYTIDFQAGGKEIAFGALASDDLTDVNGHDYSNEGLFKCKMGTAFNDMTTGAGGEVEEFISELDISGAELDTTQADWVVEQGVNGIWTWHKWESGICEVWARWEETLTNYGTWNNMNSYRSSVKQLPFQIYDAVPTYSARISTGYVLGGNLHESSANPLTQIQLYVSASASGSQSVLFVCNIKGRWE